MLSWLRSFHSYDIGKIAPYVAIRNKLYNFQTWIVRVAQWSVQLHPDWPALGSNPVHWNKHDRSATYITLMYKLNYFTKEHIISSWNSILLLLWKIIFICWLVSHYKKSPKFQFLAHSSYQGSGFETRWHKTAENCCKLKETVSERRRKGDWKVKVFSQFEFKSFCDKPCKVKSD